MNDSGQKFVISSFYSLPKPHEVFNFKTQDYRDNEEFLKLEKGELFILKEVPTERFFVINPTINFFLESFKSPTTLEDVSSLFATEANCSVAEIETYIKSFLHRMRKRRVIIKEEDLSKLNPTKHPKSKKPAKFETGQTFKDYTIHSLLTIRKESQLYLLEDKDKEIYVLKIMFPPSTATKIIQDKYIARFRKEFNVLKELEGHPSICILKTYMESSNQAFGIMEYIDGVSLRKYVIDTALTLSQKLTIIRSIIDIISHVQNKGILHGDIHNSNFMVDTSGNVKLIDFGLSNYAEPNEDEILRNGGKNYFIPPERISNNSFEFLSQRADFTSEVFQLGILAYFVLYTDLPFKGFTWKSLGHNIMNQEPDFRQSIANQKEMISEQLIAVLHKALAKDPSKRFDSASSFLEAFDKVHQLGLSTT